MQKATDQAISLQAMEALKTRDNFNQSANQMLQRKINNPRNFNLSVFSNEELSIQTHDFILPHVLSTQTRGAPT
jgi:hypothetical protein